MRRTDREVLDDTQICAIMGRCDVVHLAFARDEAPYSVPVNFGMEPDGMTLYIHSAMTGTKLELLKENDHVGFSMVGNHQLEVDREKGSCSMVYESVCGWGVMEEVTEPGEKLRCLALLMAHYGRTDMPVSEKLAQATCILALHIQKRTAKARPAEKPLTVYGTKLCKDCVACTAAFRAAGVAFEYREFSEKLSNLREFLAIRDKSPLFDGMKAEGRLGVPCIVTEDGTVSLDWESFLPESYVAGKNPG